MASPTTRHLTILITDIKGFTDKTSHRSRADIQRLLDDHRDVVLPVLEARGGRLVKTMGDAFMMTYDSPTDAVLSGVAAQEALAKHNSGLPESERIEIRVAINAGEVNLAENDVFGEAVNITARIEGVAEAGEVYFTEAVYLAMNKTEVPSSEIGLLQLKGIPEKVRVYKVRRETPVGSAQMPPRPAPVAASGFAPGEKARFASAEPPAKPAPPAGVLPSIWRRAAALLIDAMICSFILGLFTGRDFGTVHIHKKIGAPAKEAKVGLDAKGLRVASGQGDEVSLDDKGLRVKSGDGSRVEIDADGVHVDQGKVKPAGAVIYDEDGTRVEVEEGRHRGWGRWGFGLVWAVYGMVFLKWLDATPGKKILKLKVVSIDGMPLTKRQRLIRSAFSVVSGYAVFLGYLWAFWEPQRRGWHDLIAGTRVVPAE